MSVEFKDDGMIALAKPVELPDVLDMFIVGAGPAGTAAAFRAKELGLSALVVDHDDLLRRIRDFPRGKEIKPDYGKGDQMKFPRGGEMIASLHFNAIDKDELCDSWKEAYGRWGVPAQVGIELLGLGGRDGDVWQVNTYNHNIKKDVTYRARHVVLAMGGGVPRRFDIPGNTAGIAYGLTDAKKYLGQPACVAGGGTSAAEAVIAISNAKVAADDPTGVYWSYRKEKLPKVSKALADEFFDAYLGNGNIRYCPNSEPAAIVIADGRQEFLSIRIDRKLIEGRPNETAHLEFAKEFSIACLGQEVPVAFLEANGIPMTALNEEAKQRFAVTPLLETRQPNVYMAGEILAKRYIETASFDDSSTYAETPHAGNIKAAMINGVLIAEAARQKVDGKDVVDVVIEFEDAAPAAAPSKPAAAPAPAPIATMIQQSPAGAAAAGAPAAEVEAAYLLHVAGPSGSGDEYTVASSGVTTIGTKFCDVVFPDDDMLAERHASIVHGADGYSLRDDSNTSGVFLRARPGKSIEVAPGTVVRAGKQFLLFNRTDGGYSFSHYDHTGRLLNTYPVTGAAVLGRQADVSLDANDKSLSRRHMSVKIKDGKLLVKDADSVNGTHIKVGDMPIENGDEFRVGRQLLRFVTQQEAVAGASVQHTMMPSAPAPKAAAPPPPAPEPQPAPAPEPTPAAGGMTITFENHNKTCDFTAGQTICDVAEKNGIAVQADCHSGVCGGDPVRILSGQENLNPLDDDEKETLEDECGYKPGECRLACMAKPTGPVVVEVLPTRNPDA